MLWNAGERKELKAADPKQIHACEQASKQRDEEEHAQMHAGNRMQKKTRKPVITMEISLLLLLLYFLVQPPRYWISFRYNISDCNLFPSYIRDDDFPLTGPCYSILTSLSPSIFNLNDMWTHRSWMSLCVCVWLCLRSRYVLLWILTFFLLWCRCLPQTSVGQQYKTHAIRMYRFLFFDWKKNKKTNKIHSICFVISIWWFHWTMLLSIKCVEKYHACRKRRWMVLNFGFTLIFVAHSPKKRIIIKSPAFREFQPLETSHY